jgi:mono/diheme cytochrome c family protein
MARRVLLVLAVASVVAFASGCTTAYRGDDTPDDEAMQRARAEGKSPQAAARDYFLPKYYYDPAYPAKGVPNYFKGMDPIAVQPGWQPSDGPPLATPVFQLFDKIKPEFRISHPLEAEDAKGYNTAREVLGRNTWMLWCGGNEGFWDWLASDSLGFIDLLKIIDSRNRAKRFADAGLINEPGMVQGGAPSPDGFGLWLDTPSDGDTRKWREGYLRKAFRQIRDGTHPAQRGLVRYGSKYKGYDESGKPAGGSGGRSDYEPAAYYDWPGDRDNSPPPPEIYGLSSGVVGLRLFPNPYFDEEARKKWNPERYYNDEYYFNDPELIRPYRVGMACAYCHASFHPLNPPLDATNPDWSNISGNIGAQYLRIRAAFGNLIKSDNFIYHILDSQPPGTIDTSLIASDSINNPNAMNSVFNLPQRVLLSLRNPKETLDGASLTQPAVWRHPEANASPDDEDVLPEALRKVFADQGLIEVQDTNGNPRRVPRILLDGSDSIGAWGALARVYLNIGTYWEQWNRLHRPVVGLDPQRPFRVADCERHSVYWHATQLRVPALREYFLKSTPPMPLAVAAVGQHRANVAAENIAKAAGTPQEREEHAKFVQSIEEGLSKYVDVSKLARGRKVFARNCIVCHSSIQPESSAVTLFQDQTERDAHETQFKDLIARRKESRSKDAAAGEFWEHDPAQWLRDDDYIAWAEAAVENERFWQLNYLSTDYRIPINLVNTNAGRALATNAIDKNMWDDFASESYQRMRSVGSIQFFNPYSGTNGAFETFTPRHAVRNNAPAGGGGVGFYRVPTLVSIWTTAPLLHNNSLGQFNNNPSVEGRMQAFDDAIHKLLWPERRLESSSYNNATPERLRRDHGLIWRTTEPTYLAISGRRVPSLLSGEVPAIMKLGEWYAWLKNVRPLWLPTALLLLASLAYLVVDPTKTARALGYLALFLAIVSALVVYFLRDTATVGRWIDRVHPLWLPELVLLLVGFIFVVIGDARRTQLLGFATLVGAAAAFLLYLRLEYPRSYAWLVDPDPLLFLALILLAVGALLAWRRDNPKTFRLGVIALVLAVALFVLYFLGWFKWIDTGYRFALLVGFLLGAGVAIVWLAETSRMRWLGYLVLLGALVGSIFRGLGWQSYLDMGHRLVVLAAVLGVVALVLLSIRIRFLHRLGFAVLFLALVSLTLSCIQDFPSFYKSLDRAGPLWPISVLFGLGACLLFFVPSYITLARCFGYLTLVLALSTGFVVYFINGKLGDLRIGPIPAGTPVNLLANVNPDADPDAVRRAKNVAIGAFSEIQSKNFDPAKAQEIIRTKVAPELMNVNKCPDFVMDKGHYFEWFKTMSDSDKVALIELLKTF